MKIFRALVMGPVGLVLLFVFLTAVMAARACSSDTLCSVSDGAYRIVLPAETKPLSDIGAIFFFHGFTGSALETISDKGLVEIARQQGVALVAMDGLGGRWAIPGVSEPQRDEIAYVERVVDDAVHRFNLNPKRLMASGFSLGGSMVWYIACRIPERFAAFASIAGAFWEPIPESCAGKRPRMMHFHGLSDATVPMGGRLVRSGRRQGDVYKSLARIEPACAISSGPDIETGGLSCRLAAGCPADAHLELCLHPGGHDLNAQWVGRAWRAMMQQPVR